MEEPHGEGGGFCHPVFFLTKLTALNIIFFIIDFDNIFMT